MANFDFINNRTRESKQVCNPYNDKTFSKNFIAKKNNETYKNKNNFYPDRLYK